MGAIYPSLAGAVGPFLPGASGRPPLPPVGLPGPPLDLGGSGPFGGVGAPLGGSGAPFGAPGAPGGAPGGAGPVWSGRLAPGNWSRGGGRAEVQSTRPWGGTPRSIMRENVSAKAWFQRLGGFVSRHVLGWEEEYVRLLSDE